MESINETLELLLVRKSVRVYEAKPIPDEVRHMVLAAMLRAPTAGNMMLYSVIEANDPKLKARLAVTCDNQPFIATAPWVLVFLADYQRWMDYYELSGALDLRDEKLSEAARPREADLLLAASDALVAAQTVVVAAEACGLGSCYIGDIMENYETHRELLGLPRYAFPVAMLCLGYPTKQQSERPQLARFKRRHIVFENHYAQRSIADFEEMFGGDGTKPGSGLSEKVADSGRQQYLRKFASDFSAEMRRSVSRALEEWK